MKLKKVTQKLASFGAYWGAFVALTMVAMSASGQIPAVEANSDGAGAGAGIWAFASGWVRDVILFGVPVVLACVFLWMLWELWVKIQEQRQAKEPHWGGVIAFGAGAGVYFLVASFIGAAVLGIFG